MENSHVSHKKHELNTYKALILGDKGVGKSSFIATCLKNDFAALASITDKVEPNVLAPMYLPPAITLQNMRCQLIDSFGSDQDKQDPARSSILEKQVQEAQTIAVLYDMTREETLNSVKLYWLPMVKEMNPNAPVIIVGTKLDVIREQEKEDDEGLTYFTRVRKIIRPILRDFG